MQMLYCFIKNVHVDYDELTWEGLYYSLTHPTTLIPYPRFMKNIIDHYMTEHPDISRKVHENYHKVENDDIVNNIFNSRKNKKEKGMRIPDWTLTEEMKLTAHYQMTTSAPRTPNPEVIEGESSAQCKSTVIRLRVPPRRQDLKTSILTAAEIDVTNLAETIQMSIAIQRSIEDYEAQQNVEKVKEQIVDEEIENLVEGTENENVDDFLDDIFNNQEEPHNRIDLESYKESPEAEKDTDMVIISNDDVKEESARDEFELRRREKGKDAPSSADKEKLQELTVTDPTPLSSSLKPKTRRFKRYKTFIQQMGEHYGYMFAHLNKHFMPRKSFHELARIPQSTMEEASMTQADVAAMVDEAVQKKRDNLRTEITLQDDEKLRNDDLSIWWSLKIKFEKTAPSAAPCKIVAILPRDHDDHHDDAHPERENNQEPNPLGSGTQEQLDEFDAWMDDFRTDDEVPTEEVSQEL
ncbi:hypothetical protein Tco_0150590 [Tanacetum coccineum]